MTHSTSAARRASSLLTAALAAAALTMVAAPASAADDVVVDGITYASIDPADPSAGATVTGYDSATHATHPDVSLEDEVEIDGDLHDVVEVDAYAFHDEGLASVVLPSGLEIIDEWAFAGNDLTEVVFPDGVQRIYGQAFQDNALEAIRLPGSVSVVGRAAFYNNRIESATLSTSSLTALAPVTFGANLLTDVWIPASVTEVGGDVFTDNPTLEEVTFMGAAPTYTGPSSSNPISQDRSTTDPVIRFYSEHLDTFSWPSWQGFASMPVAKVSFADPMLGVEVFPNRLDVELDEGSDAPFGFLSSFYESEFDIVAPEGYALAGWAANGAPYEVGDPITGDTVFTPLWFDTTAVRSVVITPSATEVEEGGSITVTAEGFNGLGESTGDVTADMEFSSDVPTDQVVGATITFPTASPHTISGLYLPREIVAQPVVIEVVAAQVEDTTEPDEVPVVDETPVVEETPVTDEAPRAESDPDSTPQPVVAELADTGMGGQGGTIAASAGLLVFGLAALALSRRRIG